MIHKRMQQLKTQVAPKLAKLPLLAMFAAFGGLAIALNATEVVVKELATGVALTAVLCLQRKTVSNP